MWTGGLWPKLPGLPAPASLGCFQPANSLNPCVPGEVCVVGHVPRLGLLATGRLGAEAPETGRPETAILGGETEARETVGRAG